MKQARFYCKAICKGAVELDGAEAHHLADVLRLRAGDRVELFDGAGTLASAVITEIRKQPSPAKHTKHSKVKSCRQIIVQVEGIERKSPQKSGRIIIAVSVAKGERFEWVISKCTELGVDRICPVLFERTVKVLKGPAVAQRYSRLAVSAAKQCGRLFLPKIDEPTALEECLEILKKDYPQAQLLAGVCSDEARPPARIEQKDSDIIALVGPEGGMTQKEQELLKREGASQVRLSENVLRVETAAVAFAAILTAGSINTVRL